MSTKNPPSIETPAQAYIRLVQALYDEDWYGMNIEPLYRYYENIAEHFKICVECQTKFNRWAESHLNKKLASLLHISFDKIMELNDAILEPHDGPDILKSHKNRPREEVT